MRQHDHARVHLEGIALRVGDERVLDEDVAGLLDACRRIGLPDVGTVGLDEERPPFVDSAAEEDAKAPDEHVRRRGRPVRRLERLKLGLRQEADLQVRLAILRLDLPLSRCWGRREIHAGLNATTPRIRSTRLIPLDADLPPGPATGTEDFRVGRRRNPCGAARLLQPSTSCGVDNRRSVTGGEEEWARVASRWPVSLRSACSLPIASTSSTRPIASQIPNRSPGPHGELDHQHQAIHTNARQRHDAARRAS